MNQEALINDIYTFLFDNDYIDCSNNLFNQHFLESCIENKIGWIAKQSEIAAFMQLIFDYDILSKNRERKHKVRLTNDHFYFKEPSKEFGSLGKEFSVFKKDETLCPEIRNFFKRLHNEGKIQFR